jgi:hypothetical protein
METVSTLIIISGIVVIVWQQCLEMKPRNSKS